MEPTSLTTACVESCTPISPPPYSALALSSRSTQHTRYTHLTPLPCYPTRSPLCHVACVMSPNSLHPHPDLCPCVVSSPTCLVGATSSHRLTPTLPCTRLRVARSPDVLRLSITLYLNKPRLTTPRLRLRRCTFTHCLLSCRAFAHQLALPGILRQRRVEFLLYQTINRQSCLRGGYIHRHAHPCTRIA